MFSACAQPSAHVSTMSSKAPGKPRRAFVDAPLAFYKVPQWLIQVFEFCRVPQNPRPFSPRALIGLVTEALRALFDEAVNRLIFAASVAFENMPKKGVQWRVVLRIRCNA